MKRTGTPITADAPDKTSRQTGSRHPRTSVRGGPSSRERMVSSQINSQVHPTPSIQEKLTSTLAAVGRQIASDQAPHKSSVLEGMFTRRTTKRKPETNDRAPVYEASARGESKRVNAHEPEFKAQKSRRTFDARAEAAPPVMVRGGMGGMAFGRAASSRIPKGKIPRRRMDIPLNVPGAELRLPSMPLVRLGSRVTSLLIVLMCLGSLVMIWQASVFQVRSVEAVGLKRLTAAELNTVMGMAGKSVFTLDHTILLNAIQQAFPEFSKVSVRISLPANVKVVVTEREPIISWTQDGVESWVDAEGVSFPVRGTVESALVRVEGYGTPPGAGSTAESAEAEDFPGVAAVTSPITLPKLRLTKELVQSILALGAKMPADTLLVYDSQHGLGWNDPNGWEVFFGAEDQDTQMKLVVYQALVERLQSEGIQPALISVEYVHAPYYRMER